MAFVVAVYQTRYVREREEWSPPVALHVAQRGEKPPDDGLDRWILRENEGVFRYTASGEIDDLAPDRDQWVRDWVETNAPVSRPGPGDGFNADSYCGEYGVKWTRENSPDILWQADPDKALALYADAVENEAMVQSRTVRAIRAMQDVNECDPRYLPYLADAVGIRLSAFDTPGVWRAQIRSAIRWYKERGLPRAFDSVLSTNGLDGSVLPLWIDQDNQVVASAVSPGDGWKPHARIDIGIAAYPAHLLELDDPFGYVTRVIEEVRPAHVLLRGQELAVDLGGPDKYVPAVTDADAFDLPSMGVWDIEVPEFVACGQWVTAVFKDRKLFEDHPANPPQPPEVTQIVSPALSLTFCDGSLGLVPVNAEQGGVTLGQVFVETGEGVVPLLAGVLGTLPTLEVDSGAPYTVMNGLFTVSVRFTDCESGDTSVKLHAKGGGYAGSSGCFMVTEKVCYTITRYDAVFDCVQNKWCLAGQKSWEDDSLEVTNLWINAPWAGDPDSPPVDSCRRYLYMAQGRPGACTP